MYESFMLAIDAIDTGVEVAAEVNFRENTGLSSRIARMNPRWNEENTPEVLDSKFEEASKVCGNDFLDVLSEIVESQIPAIDLVEEALLKRHDVDKSGKVMMFPNGGMPWKKHLYALEKKHEIEKLIKFVLCKYREYFVQFCQTRAFYDSQNLFYLKFRNVDTDQSGMWRIQAVTEEGFAFKNRLSLPEAWRGVRDDDLSKVANIEGCTFCHATGFIGGNKSYDGVLQMARAALDQETNLLGN